MRHICNNYLLNQVRLSNLTNKEKFHALKFHMYIYQRQAIEINLNEDEFTYINLEAMTSKFTILKNQEMHNCINWLESNGWIEINHSYRVGLYSKAYSAKWNLEDRIVSIKLEEFLTKRGITAINKKFDLLVDSSIEQVSEFDKFSLDYDRVEKAFFAKFNIKYSEIELHLSNRKIFKWYTSIKSLEQRTYHCSKSSLTGRVFTTFTMMPKELRACLKHSESNCLYELDIVNAQPFFLLSLIEKHNLSCETEIVNVIKRGKFYELLIDLWKSDSRKETKIRTYKSILFSSINDMEKYKKTSKVSKKFPLFYLAVKELKEIGSLATQLQTMESDLIFDFLKTEQLNFCTVHDSILIPKSISIVKSINAKFKRFAFNRLNIKIKTNLEDLKK